MSNRRPHLLLAALICLSIAAAALAGCGQTSEPEPSPSPSPEAPLALGQTAVIGGFEMTPAVVRTRSGAVYDAAGKRIKGTGVKVRIKVAKTREADISGSDGELTVPVARLVASDGQSVRMDDFFGMLPEEGQSAEYGRLYASSYQYACVQAPGTSRTATLWFSIPQGVVPEELVIDGGAGRQATWLLP